MSVEEKKIKTVRYTLPFLEGSDAPTQEFYSINGKDYIIKRGEAVSLPENVYNYIIKQEEAKNEAIRRAMAKSFKDPTLK